MVDDVHIIISTLVRTDGARICRIFTQFRSVYVGHQSATFISTVRMRPCVSAATEPRPPSNHPVLLSSSSPCVCVCVCTGRWPGLRVGQGAMASGAAARGSPGMFSKLPKRSSHAYREMIQSSSRPPSRTAAPPPHLPQRKPSLLEVSCSCSKVYGFFLVGQKMRKMSSALFIRKCDPYTRIS